MRYIYPQYNLNKLLDDVTNMYYLIDLITFSLVEGWLIPSKNCQLKGYK